jgi:hypothetical protein
VIKDTEKFVCDLCIEEEINNHDDIEILTLSMAASRSMTCLQKISDKYEDLGLSNLEEGIAKPEELKTKIKTFYSDLTDKLKICEQEMLDTVEGTDQDVLHEFDGIKEHKRVISQKLQNCKLMKNERDYIGTILESQVKNSSDIDFEKIRQLVSSAKNCINYKNIQRLNRRLDNGSFTDDLVLSIKDNF